MGSQELNMSAIVIEPWQSNISKCQYGQNAGKTNQEHSIWHALLEYHSFCYRGLKLVDDTASVTLL